MIYYATRQTLQRYKIKTLDEIFAGEVTPEEARFLAQVRQESGDVYKRQYRVSSIGGIYQARTAAFCIFYIVPAFFK